MKKKAQAFVWLFVMFVIFAMGLIYTVFSQPFHQVVGILEKNVTGTPYEPTKDKIVTIWDFFLLIFLIAMIIWGILAAQRRNPNEV